MGIQGLLVALKPYTESGNIRDYAGSAIAVDASSWLHKSVYSIADHYVEQCVERAPNHPDQRCIQVAAKYVTNRCQEWFVGNIPNLFGHGWETLSSQSRYQSRS